MDNNNRRPQNIENTDINNTDLIRQNEYNERQQRSRRIDADKRMQRRKQRRIQQIKTAIKAWATLIGGLFVVVALVILVVSLINGANKKPPENPNKVDQKVSELSQQFYEAQGIFYASGENNLMSLANTVVNDIALSDSLSITTTDASALHLAVRRFAWHSDRTNLRKVKDTLRDFPIFSNGYVWSEETSMKSPKNGFYLYDTNARFISAVCEVALWEADTSFLYEKDETSQPRLDASQGRTVLEKLEMAAEYYFDKNDLNGGGIRYNDADFLVYILTDTNNGESNGGGSNYWFNHRFGYLDAYNNIAFNEAMVSLAKLYILMGQPEKAQEYTDIAQKNKGAFNNAFWNSTLGRYIGAKDSSGSSHDLGFTFLNLEAISAGLSDQEKTKSIFSWLDGKNIINTDTSSGEDIYKFGYAPRSTTIKANDSWWDYVGGSYPLSSTAGFGEYYQNGGASLVTAYYDLLSRKTVSDKSFKTRFKAYAKDAVGAALADKKCENGASAAMAVYGLFGIDTDGSTLFASPCIKQSEGYVGIKNIGFGINSYDFVFGENLSLVFARFTGAVRLKLGGFEKGQMYNVRIVQNGEYTSNIPLEADENGVLAISERFGEESYLVIEKQIQNEDKK